MKTGHSLGTAASEKPVNKDSAEGTLDRTINGRSELGKPQMLVDGKAIANFLDISYPTLLRWLSEGQGPPHYLLNEPKLSIGNSKKRNGQPRRPRHLIRFKLSEVEEWLEGRKR